MKDKKSTIKTYGKGWVEERSGIKVLHLRGTPYERGYQHGFLLADEISVALTSGITTAAAVIAFNGGSDVSTAMAKLMIGKDAAGPYVPPEFKAEIQGIADGIAAAGSSLNRDDIVLWNTMYDQRCFYSHANAAEPNRPAVRHAYPPGCSSFSAWGKATLDGRMVFGKNMDNFCHPGIEENRILVVVDPDVGYGHAFVTHPGMLAIDGGLNEDGVAMMTQLSASVNETMQGCGIAILTRLILANVHRIEDAINILTVYPRCTGINYHVADAKVNRAAVIEVSATEVAVRHPEQGRDALWTSNHYNCYPGWKGYTGYNMVIGQAPAYGLTDVSTIEKWQASLREESPTIPAAGRFERYQQLIEENYGRITVEKATEILSDRHYPDTGKEREWTEPSPWRRNRGTICALAPKQTFAEDVAYYKSDKRGPIAGQGGCLWSLAALPANGDFSLAIKDLPAQRGPWEYFNLMEELCR